MVVVKGECYSEMKEERTKVVVWGKGKQNLDLLKIAGESQKRKGGKAGKSEHAIFMEMGKMHSSAQENGLASKTGELGDKEGREVTG